MRWSVVGCALALWLAGCQYKGGDGAPAKKADAATAAAKAEAPTPKAAEKTGEVVFDPNNPPPGWMRCHRNHCHHESGRVAS
ncbi:MAG: hypothetical protein KC583_05745, partial [Myxococcales bacterium]|nr:hypothetical protein [Myxococcales bacterium]